MSGRRRPQSRPQPDPANPSEAPDGLSDRQRRFVDEYLIDLNIAAAARRAGYAPTTAHAPDKLVTPAVEAAIERAMADRARRTRLQSDLVLTELARLAFANLFDFITVEPDGAPRIDFRNVARDDAAALQCITVDYYRPAPIRWRDKQRAAEDGRPAPEPEPFDAASAPPRRIRIALHDKRAALRELSQHLGVIAPDNRPAAGGDDAKTHGYGPPHHPFTRIITNVPRPNDMDCSIGVIWRHNPDGSCTPVDEREVIEYYLPRGEPKSW